MILVKSIFKHQYTDPFIVARATNICFSSMCDFFLLYYMQILVHMVLVKLLIHIFI